MRLMEFRVTGTEQGIDVRLTPSLTRSTVPDEDVARTKYGFLTAARPCVLAYALNNSKSERMPRHVHEHETLAGDIVGGLR